ncbi:MAG TPA: hypothetical protein VFN35_35960, partial [Ktedonobacteraceae bacterium]|nr:hypothetical protein [Ktedonobacteraceae bacterium]
MRRQKPSQKQTRQPTHSAISPPEKNLQQNTETTEHNDEITQTSGNRAPANPLPDYHFGQLPLHAPFLATAPGAIAINQPGDRYEQEAEQIAKEIIHMPTPQREAPLASADETANNSSGQPLQDATRAFMEPR